MPKYDKLPPLKYDGVWAVDELVPGFIEAHAGIQVGCPCLIGTRLPTYAKWVWHDLDDPVSRKRERLTREQIIALYCFEAGVEWQRSRLRRQRMDEAVNKGWENYRGKENSAQL